MTLDIKKILVPLDFSPNSELALDYAMAMAERFGAALHLVHVCEVPAIVTGSADAYAIAYTDWSQRLGEEAERELNTVTARVAGVPFTSEVLFGTPARCIVTAAATQGADLIVMGTHGRGPVMHMVMGNVAERVVRMAPCPVLTVRSPRAPEKDVAPVAKAATTGLTVLCAAAAFALAALLTPSPALAQDAPAPPPMKQALAGGELFRTYCATCHGTSARGDGPLASSMRRQPSNLTEIARRNGGVFPSELVFRTIDGKNPVRGHGGPDMPVWGDAFARSRDGGDAAKIQSMIQSLVDFLESIQAQRVN